MYAVVRVRGIVGPNPDVAKTCELLNLRRANNASIWPENNQTKRMIKLIENFATYGIIDDATLKELITKRGEPTVSSEKIDVAKVVAGIKAGKKPSELGLKNCFRLNPPRKGFERAGIKQPYSLGGALGNRKEEINALLKRMM